MAKKTLTDSFIRHHDNPEKRLEIYDRLISGLAVRITPTGHKSFVYRYRHGKNVKRFTIGKFPTVGLAKAREIAKELHIETSRGKDPLEEKKKRKEAPKTKTFNDLVEAFEDYHLPTLRKKTRDEYERIIEANLKPRFKNKALDNIHQNDIRDMIDEIAIKNGKKTMANRVRATLSVMFSVAQERGYRKDNPVSSVPRVKGAETRRERFYSEPEIQELWKAFDLQPEPARSVYKMLLLCGQRSKETRYMKWTDIHDGVWTIPAELSKSKREHGVPLSPFALEVLEERKEIAGDSKFVFESPRKKGFPLEGLKGPNIDVRDDSEVPDFKPHDLRRTVATYMAKLNVDRTALGKVLNHKGLSGDSLVTAIYDRHSYREQKSKALNRWANYLRQIIEGKEKKIHKIG